MWPFSSMMRGTDEAEARNSDWFPAFIDLARPVAAGVSVNQDSAVNLPSVYKCVSLNAETISSLPVDVFAKRGDERVQYPEPAWLRSPNDFQSFREFIAMTQASLDLDGNCFWLKAVDGAGRVVGLSVLAPSAVDPVVENIGGRPSMVYWVSTNGGREPVPATAVVHLRGMVLPGQVRGLSPIECAKQTIGIGIAAEQYGGQFFGNGANLSGLVSVPGGLTPEQADRLKEAFTKRHGGISKSHAVGVLSGGATWQPMSVKPDEAQFLESRKYTATEIANLYGVPPELVTDVDGAKGYVTALSARLRLWYLTGLLPRLVRIEDALSSLLPRPAYVKFNRNALLQMDPSERTSYYQAAQLGEWMSVEEIRALEDMDPKPKGTVLHSVQWQENAPEPPPPEPSEPDVDDEPASAGSPVKEGDQ